MIWYWTGFLLILHVCLWGWGLTLLLLPARWRRFWPAFCAPVGIALQSAVVWIGTHTTLPGTDRYALASLALPVTLAVAAFMVFGRTRIWQLLAVLRRWWAVGLIMAFSLVLQAYPFTKPPRVLTSIAMTSCDAADYAAGARVFKEFAHGDRTGFLGEPEDVRQLTVDNFYDFFLCINHFTPSALIALDASLFNRSPYELTTLMGVVLLTLHLPSVFWLARSAFRFGPLGSLAATFLYGVSPALYYAMYQVALGQLLAAPAIILLTWTGLQAFRGPPTLRRHAAYSGLLLAGNWLLLGSYNFFLAFAYTPLAAYVGLRTLVSRRWIHTIRWSALICLNLLVCAALVPERVISVVRRFLLFNKTPFGWPIPGFYPSAWYGAFSDIYLHPAAPWLSSSLGGLCLAALAFATIRQWRRGMHTPLLAASCTLPIFFGYWLLLREDSHQHDNASYDAYKLFTVFYPGILIGLCLWLRPLGRAGTFTTACSTLLWVILLAVNIFGDRLFNTYLRLHGYRVGPPLQSLSRLETMSALRSVNVNLPAYWDRLWANCFLLRKTQFLPLPTYEGRMVRPSIGQWDLDDRRVFVRHATDDDPLANNPDFSLLNRDDPRFLSARLDSGWYDAEQVSGVTWYWASGSPRISILNPHRVDMDFLLTLTIRSVHGRSLRLCTDSRQWWAGNIPSTITTIRDIPLSVHPRTTLLRFDTTEPPERVPGDPRPLTFYLGNYQIAAPSSKSSAP